MPADRSSNPPAKPSSTPPATPDRAAGAAGAPDAAATPPSNGSPAPGGAGAASGSGGSKASTPKDASGPNGSSGSTSGATQPAKPSGESAASSARDGAAAAGASVVGGSAAGAASGHAGPDKPRSDTPRPDKPRSDKPRSDTPASSTSAPVAAPRQQGTPADAPRPEARPDGRRPEGTRPDVRPDVSRPDASRPGAGQSSSGRPAPGSPTVAAPAPTTTALTASAAAPSEPDTPAELDTDATPKRRRKAGLVVASIVVVLGLAYGIAYLVAGNSLARGATVAGVEVGGLSPEDAEAKLEAELPALVDVPLHATVADGETTHELIPSEIGLTVDIPATVSAVPGGSANPVSLVKALLGADEVEPVPAVDRPALEAALTAIGEESDTAAVNGAVAFDEGAVVTSEPVAGKAVDVAAGSDALEQAFFGGDGIQQLPLADVALPITDVAPLVTSEEVARAAAEFAEPAMSAPVTIVAGDQSVEMGPELIGQALTLVPDDSGTLTPALDGAKLSEVAHEALAEIGQEGKDATIRIEDGGPVVVPAEQGQGIAADALSAAVLPALTEEGEARQAAVELTEVDPALTTEAAEALGVTEVVAEMTTHFPYAEYRNTNIGLAAQKIDNTLLQPDEDFSLNGLVGERTAANGFAIGTTINGGKLVEDYGGGVSQVATTTYHAAFLAGLQDIHHQPHSIYFDRYPVGQEATVSWGSFDMSFKNDTPYGVLVDTVFTAATPGSNGTLTVKIWSTPHFTVETSVSERSNFTSPPVVHDDGGSCVAQGGWEGFDITSYRTVKDPTGAVVKDESYPWTYRPNPRVVCGDKPRAD